MVIELIIGTMFGGKTTELIRRLDRCAYANQKTVLFSMDNRTDGYIVETHSGSKTAAVKVKGSQDVAEYLSSASAEVDVIGIDEVQFFDKGIVQLCHKLARQGKRVIVAGLDQDYKGEPFETTLLMVLESERVDKLTAVCVICGSEALRNYRLGDSSDRIMQGDSTEYLTLCRTCFIRRS